MISAAFILGLMGSAHCIGMCGPIALALPLDRSSRSNQWLGALSYNLGRTSTYAALGLIFGQVGRALSLIGIQRWISIGAGALLLIYVVFVYILKRPLRLFPRLTIVMGRLKEKFYEQFNKRSLGSLFSIGTINGLLPCGLVYFALIGAIESGQASQGALFMTFFGLGTTPLMLATNMLGSRIGSSDRLRINKAIPFVLSLFALLFILRGMSLGIPFISPAIEAGGAAASCCHK